MRKSSRVTLVLMGMAALAGCNRVPDSQREVYATREDCLSDWGNKPEDCKPATEPSHAARGFWYGPILPSYYGSGYGSSWSSHRSLGTTSSTGHSSSISRGGFGSSARASSGS
ncbi:MAG TPA: hypothetical protein VLJ84_00240 [Usitatibacter sp.]|jgi:uncharacterized protein YgiB involved in biofilm formation|nr:hypothetical protein [Usitatibacter sp.]HST00069.1 hypothetical protein [Usitatibacter sp.]